MAADTLQEYKAFRFLSKETIRDEGLAVLVDVVARARKACSLHPFGPFDDPAQGRLRERAALDFLAGHGEDCIIRYNRWLNALGKILAQHSLEDLLAELFGSLGPTLPPVAAQDYLIADADHALLSGRFWSKVLRKAVYIVVCSVDNVKNVEGTRPEWRSDREVLLGGRRYVKDKLAALIFELPTIPRSSFASAVEPVKGLARAKKPGRRGPHDFDAL